MLCLFKGIAQIWGGKSYSFSCMKTALIYLLLACRVCLWQNLFSNNCALYQVYVYMVFHVVRIFVFIFSWNISHWKNLYLTQQNDLTIFFREVPNISTVRIHSTWSLIKAIAWKYLYTQMIKYIQGQKNFTFFLLQCANKPLYKPMLL